MYDKLLYILRMPTTLSHYVSHDICNADDFGLFYRALPTKSMDLKGKKCTRDKNSKIQLTAAKMFGEKIPIFVIG